MDAADPLPAHGIIVMVWDGMRPDFISPETTPNLSRLATGGVFFAHHHPVYLSATEVNGAALATGAYPAHERHHRQYRLSPRDRSAESGGHRGPGSRPQGGRSSGGHYLNQPTVAEILHAHGLATVIAGSKQIALLQDRLARAAAPGVSPTLYQGEVLPLSVQSTLTQALGDFPKASPHDDRIARDTWTVGALLGTLWRDGVPPYTLLWLAEPDSSQHASGPGSAQSLEAYQEQ